MLSLAKLALLASPLVSTTLAAYSISQDYTGRAFFEGFKFFTGPDPTSGHVKYIDMTDANNSGIAGFMNGGHAKDAVYLGVDAMNESPQGRRSTRVESTKTFNNGLIIVDIVHMPGGICGTWPAFWMVGPNWPADGEIDIIEGVNDQQSNKMAAHTGPGMAITKNEKYSGELLTPNCDVNAPGQPNNAGCLISDNDTNTYGAGFNKNGGGVFATELNSKGINIWFFPRDKIPADITAGKPSPCNNWGTPRGSFTGNFTTTNHFRDLRIVFDTTFCGQWAGIVWEDSASCSAMAPTCEEFVTKNSTAFREAYWAINSLKVFQSSGSGMNATAKHKKYARSGGAVLPGPV